MSWINYIFIAILLYSSFGIFQKIAATKSKNDRASSFIFNASAVISSLIYLLVTQQIGNLNFSSTNNGWLILLTICFFYALFERGRFTVLKYLDASTSSIVSEISVFIAFTGSLILYHETLSLQKIIGTLFIITSLYLLARSDSKKTKITLKGFLLSCLIFSFAGIASALDKSGASHFNSNTYNLLIWFIPLLFIYFPKISTKDLAYELKHSGHTLFISGSMNAFAYLFYIKALTLTQATTVIPLIQTTTIITVILAAIFLKESNNLKRKILCAILSLIGTSLLLIS